MKPTKSVGVMAGLALIAVAACKIVDQEADAATGALDGTYDLNPAACFRAGPSETRVIIADGQLKFYETLCKIREIRPEGNAFSTILSCEGEGTSWRSDVLMQPRSGGLIMVEDDFSSRDYHRCD